MPNNLRHFAIHADDVERARTFYQAVFGWRFEPFGPPDFYRILTGTPEDPGIWGAVQKRPDRLDGRGLRGFECTVSVDDLERTLAAVERHGGKLVFPEYEIPGVGRLFKFEDTEGNLVVAMQYLPERLAELQPRTRR